jgi:predicted TPR repeat methyltransferase
MEFLSGRVGSIIGVDVSPEMLSIARRKLPTGRLVCADLTKANSFVDRKYDLITAFRFLANAEARLRRDALEVLARLLSDSGLLVINSHQHADALYPRTSAAYHVLTGQRISLSEEPLNTAKMIDLLEGVGLRILKVYAVGLLHVPGVSPKPSIFHRVDRAASSWQGLACRSASPVFVCQRRRS